MTNKMREILLILAGVLVINILALGAKFLLARYYVKEIFDKSNTQLLERSNRNDKYRNEERLDK